VDDADDSSDDGVAGENDRSLVVHGNGFVDNDNIGGVIPMG
jgi:hypothetical protein